MLHPTAVVTGGFNIPVNIVVFILKSTNLGDSERNAGGTLHKSDKDINGNNHQKSNYTH